MNLIVNAQHAMRRAPGARRLTLGTRHDRERGHIRLEVGDTGPGIPREIQARIFEPFFTTKPSGEGTGLGLSLCQSIIKEHGGTLTVESEPGRGATFRIELPVVAPPAAATKSAPEETLPAPTPRAILVVDDEAEIAALLAEMLEGAGHRVEIAADGAVALEMLERRGYDLILTLPARVARVFERRGKLKCLPPPVPIPQAEVAVHWHERFEADPGNRWLRERVIELFSS